MIDCEGRKKSGMPWTRKSRKNGRNAKWNKSGDEEH
jgi:hypothetical protein